MIKKMKVNIAFIIFSMFFCLMAEGQTLILKDTVKHIAKVKLFQKNNLGDNYTEEVSFAVRGDSIFSMDIVPKENELVYLRSEFYQGPFKQKFKFFDLNFSADRLIFKKDYPKIQYPTREQIEFVKSSIQMDSISYYHLSSVQQFSDSTLFTFRLQPLVPRTIADSTSIIPTSWGRCAEFLGNLRNVENIIAKKMKSIKIKSDIDSIIVFRALVTREEYPHMDSLIVEKLLYGKTSKFSDIVKKELVSPKNGRWRAAVWANNGQRTTTRIKIFAQLKKNGTVQIQLPRKLGNWTGD
jgi:hypothetical protein